MEMGDGRTCCGTLGISPVTHTARDSPRKVRCGPCVSYNATGAGSIPNAVTLLLIVYQQDYERMSHLARITADTPHKDESVLAPQEAHELRVHKRHHPQVPPLSGLQ